MEQLILGVFETILPGSPYSPTQIHQTPSSGWQHMVYKVILHMCSKLKVLCRSAERLWM